MNRTLFGCSAKHVLLFKPVRSQYHSRLLSVPNGCWDPRDPEEITVSCFPAQKSAAAQRSGADSKAISSEDVPEQLWMPSNILQLPQFWAALSQHSYHAVSNPYPSLTGVNGRKTHQSGQLLIKNTQSGIKIRYYLEICPILGQKRSSSVCSQPALSLEEGGQGKAAQPALPNARQRGGPGTAPRVDNTFRLRHVCSLPTPRPASVGFF